MYVYETKAYANYCFVFLENGPYNARSQRVELKFEFRPKVTTRIEKSSQKNIITIHKDIYTRKLVYFLIYN